jgi:hypothetical protein
LIKKKENKIQKQNELQKYYLGIVLIVAFIFLSVPLFRFFSGTYAPGSEPYYHLRISNMLHSKITDYDNLSFSGRTYYLNLNHLIISRFNNILFFILFLPMIFGILSVFLFYKILERFNISKDRVFIISLVLVSSPIFMYTFTVFNLYFLSIFLILLSLYFLIKENILIPLICVVLLPFFNLALFPFALFLLFMYYWKHEKKGFIILAITLPIVSLIYYAVVFYPLFLPQVLSLEKQSFLTFLISDFGSEFGFSAFLLVLALIGFYFTWKDKKEYLQFYILLLVLLTVSYFFPKTNLFLNFFVVYLAGSGIYLLLTMKWKLEVIKTGTILLVICGLLFSGLSYFSRLKNMEPTKEQIKSLNFIKSYSGENELVLSHYKNGFWIEFFSERPTVLDEYIYYAPNLLNRYNDSNSIFYSRKLNFTETLLDKYNIKYIWIDSKMKSGLIWEKEEQGLLFLLQNKETFKNIYNSSEVEVWEYIN